MSTQILDQLVRQRLSDLGHQTAHELEWFIKIYDLKFDRTNFVDIYNAKIARMDEVQGSFDSMMTTMETLVVDLGEGTLEYDYSYALGNYLCEISNTINTYRHRLEIIKHHQINGNKLRGIFRGLKNNREHKRHESAYLRYGRELTVLWKQLGVEKG